MSKTAVKKAVTKKAVMKKVARKAPSVVGKVSSHKEGSDSWRFVVPVYRMPVLSGRMYKTEASALKAGKNWAEKIQAAAI